MDLTSSRVIKELLLKQGAFASKRLGQNFLTDRSVLNKIISAANLRPTDIILEIGPGIGTLTQELAKRAKKIIAVEKDGKMVEILEETLAEFKNVEIVQGDILEVRPPIGRSDLPKYKVVANLPYYITSAVIRQSLENTQVRPVLMVLMVQKEVAQRICAKPPEMSLLAVSVQFYAKPEIISYVSRSSFRPQPRVDSAIIKIVPVADVGINARLIPVFFKIVRTGFSHPRKQLINNFYTGFGTASRQIVQDWLLGNGVKPSQRAETLSVEDWIKLAKSFKIN